MFKPTFAFSARRSRPCRQCVRKLLRAFRTYRQDTDAAANGRASHRVGTYANHLGGGAENPVAFHGVVLVRIFPARRR